MKISKRQQELMRAYGQFVDYFRKHDVFLTMRDFVALWIKQGFIVEGDDGYWIKEGVVFEFEED